MFIIFVYCIDRNTKVKVAVTLEANITPLVPNLRLLAKNTESDMLNTLVNRAVYTDSLIFSIPLSNHKTYKLNLVDTNYHLCKN